LIIDDKSFANFKKEDLDIAMYNGKFKYIKLSHVLEEDFDFVMNDTMQKIRGDLDLTYNQIKIALSSIPYNIFLMAELPA